MIDEARAPRLGLDVDFAGLPPGGASDRAELWRRLWFTLGALIVYRIGCYVPLPGLDLAAVDRLRHIDFFAGGVNLPDLSIFSLGIMPYISALIIVQLAGSIFPRLGGSTAGSAAKPARFGNYVRILTVALATFEAFGIAANLRSIAEVVTLPDHLFTVTTVMGLVAGAMFVTWLAHQITARGIGDGALLILACSVVSGLPYNLIQAFEAVRMGAVGIAAVLGVLLMMAAFLAVVVFVESAEHHVSLNNPENRTVESSRLGSYRKVLLRINPAGVVPALAAAIFVTPLLQSIEAIDWLKVVIGRYIGAGTFDLVYGALLVLFAAYFNVAMLNPRSTVRRPTESPDDDAADTHAHRMQSLLVALGTCYVAAVCMLPLLIYRWTVWPFLLSGFQIFLLGWVMTRILEQVRAS